MKPKLTSENVVKLLNQIGRGKLRFILRTEILKNDYSFRNFSMEYGGFRIGVSTAIGEISYIKFVKRKEPSDHGWDYWDWEKEKARHKRAKNPWDLTTDAARVRIDRDLRLNDDGSLVKVKQVWIVYHDQTPAGMRLSRGRDNNHTVTDGKTQLTFPVECTKHHTNPAAAKAAAERLKKYLNLYDKKRKPKKRKR